MSDRPTGSGTSTARAPLAVDAVSGEPLAIEIVKLRPSAVLPHRATEGAAGFDLTADVEAPVAIAPGRMAKIPTGLALAVPRGFEAQVRPRSGLAAKHAITVLNSPGTIDSDYRGEVQVLVVNLGDASFEVTPGLRIAQLVIAAVPTVELREVESLDATARGEGGFGSTGTR